MTTATVVGLAIVVLIVAHRGGYLEKLTAGAAKPKPSAPPVYHEALMPQAYMGPMKDSNTPPPTLEDLIRDYSAREKRNRREREEIDSFFARVNAPKESE
jgi:hypothetical protein